MISLRIKCTVAVPGVTCNSHQKARHRQTRSFSHVDSKGTEHNLYGHIPLKLD